MKFIALVSGGKDSCFNILHCLNAGHELVAIANLHPKADRPDEIDSWMFQTVGHQALECFTKCAEVPLFRTEISEDEDAVIDELTLLFKKIRSEIAFDGVSVGAIASTYQQVRVDRACAELNLRSLAYLWQRDQRELLREINRSGMDVRVIKVAGQGLGKEHLGKTLSSIEDELLEMNSAFGLHPCGEGGEYETMVFDTPFFRKHRMVMSNQKIVHHSTDDVYYLDFAVTTEEKSASKITADISASVRVPPLLEDAFSDMYSKLQEGFQHNAEEIVHHIDNCNQNRNRNPPESPLKIQTISFRGTFSSCFEQIDDFFSQKPHGLHLAFHVIVLLKDMTKFAAMNQEYNAVFSKAVPTVADGVAPSRACLEAAIPWDIQTSVLYTEELDRSAKGIHVQGLSYWAPASIGPYSQCRLMNGISYVAGQIGLIPASLALETDVAKQAVLALQSATRVLNVIHEKAENWTPRLAIAWITDPNNKQLVENIWGAYSRSTITRGEKLPLITVAVESLPRQADVEWSVQGCDTRFFEWYIPEDDEEEEAYSQIPEVLELSSTGYVHRAGFQTLVASTSPLEEFHLVFSNFEPPNSAETPVNWTPTRNVYYNGTAVDQLYVKL